MSFAARPMTGADVIPLEGVTVREAQEDFVAPNIVTIAQARFRAGAHDFCLWDGGRRVGLLALIDLAEYDKRKDADHPNGVYVWRLLIGSNFQGKGYGKLAMAFAETWASERNRTVMQVHAVDANTPAIKLYETLGYALTGERDGDEVQLEKLL